MLKKSKYKEKWIDAINDDELENLYVNNVIDLC